ncbi:MAG TPA: arylsulfotransferase family protein [Solirubrobacteraceae bacterium]
MSARRATGALLAVAGIGVTLCACGGASSATSDVLAADSGSAAAAGAVTVSPLPGTPDASPATQISFLGGAGTQVSDVRVVGSHSGAHGGSLRAYSTGTGESFLPSHPFKTGERVSVHARVSSGGATQTVGTSFTIANQDSPSQKQFPINPGDPHAVQHYSSAPELTPSTVRITTPAKPGASAGDLFLAPYQGKGSPGPMISDQAGNLVWFHPLPAGDDATNFEVQQYEGKPVLTWWQGRILEVGFGQGEDLLYNSSYQHVATIFAGNGYHADLHEVRITPQGTAWIDMFALIHMNLSSAHGEANGVLADSVVQEIDIKTGLVIWEWHALGHVALSESNNPAPKVSYPWDYVHINSISPGPVGSAGGVGADQPGNVLLSSRSTWTLYDVDLHTGAIRWRLGGSHSSFKLGSGTRFYWQHDAEWQPGGLISMFDNGSDPPKEKQSRGLLLAPNTANHSVSLVRQFTNPTKTLLAESQGNLLNMASAENTSGNWLMGYGGLPNFTEYDASGHVLLDGTLGKNVQSFRTYLSPWSGQPTSAPAVAVAGSAVVASWNGATNVASWRVLAGSSPTTLAAVASGAKSGFQTTVSLPASAAYVAVQALDPSGAVLGTSRTIKD